MNFDNVYEKKSGLGLIIFWSKIFTVRQSESFSLSLQLLCRACVSRKGAKKLHSKLERRLPLVAEIAVSYSKDEALLINREIFPYSNSTFWIIESYFSALFEEKAA